MELKPKNSVKSIIKRAVKRDLTADRFKINPQVVRKELQPKSEKYYSQILIIWYL